MSRSNRPHLPPRRCAPRPATGAPPGGRRIGISANRARIGRAVAVLGSAENHGARDLYSLTIAVHEIHALAQRGAQSPRKTGEEGTPPS